MDKSVTVSMQISNTRDMISTLKPRLKCVLWGTFFGRKEKTLNKLEGCERWPLFFSWAVKLCHSQHQLYMQFQWEIFIRNCWWNKLYHKLSITLDVFSMCLIFEKSKLRISHFLKPELVIDLENNWQCSKILWLYMFPHVWCNPEPNHGLSS